MSSDGSPPVLVYHHLKPYIPNNIVLVELEYDFSTTESSDRYIAARDALIERLIKGDLKQ